MKREYASGVIVFHREKNGEIQFLMIQSYGNYWGFPKGRLELNETYYQTALRELQEETGITNVHIISNLKFHESYIIKKKIKPFVEKHITYFVGEVDTKDAERQKSEIKQLGWFSLDYAKNLVVPDRKNILDHVHAFITGSEKITFHKETKE